MLKELFQYIVSLSERNTFEIQGETFADGELYRVEESNAETLTVNTLSGMVDYIKSNFDDKQDYEQLLIQVLSPTRVRLYSKLNNNKNRDLLIEANARIPEFEFGRYYDTESFNVKIQSCFLEDEFKEIVLKVVGNIREDNVKNYGDDGIAQTVTAKVGVASVDNVVVPSPITLRPYRTFQQVEQPASNFIFRMKDGPSAALHEADGGAWEVEAIENIAEYFIKELSSEIQREKIFVIS